MKFKYFRDFYSAAADDDSKARTGTVAHPYDRGSGLSQEVSSPSLARLLLGPQVLEYNYFIELKFLNH